MAGGTPIRRVYGMGAEFPSAAALFRAAEKVRDAGFRRWDVHSPFPIHGMDGAMGLGKSWLSAAVLVAGTLGCLTAFVLAMYPSVIEYKLVVHGKPTDFFTLPAFVPILFELTVLFASFAAFFGWMVFNGLPRWNHPVFNWERFSKVTDDGFFLVIESRDPRFSEAKARELLEAAGGSNIELIEEE